MVFPNTTSTPQVDMDELKRYMGRELLGDLDTTSVIIRPSLLRPSPLAIEMESSKFSPTSLSKMKTSDVKNSYCPQPKRVDYGREEFVNSVQFDGSL
jgi:hypothetical protein